MVLLTLCAISGAVVATFLVVAASGRSTQLSRMEEKHGRWLEMPIDVSDGEYIDD